MENKGLTRSKHRPSMTMRDDVLLALRKLLGCDRDARDLEAGIFNWVLQAAQSKGAVCAWHNPTFARLYAAKARSILVNANSVAALCGPRPHEVAWAPVHDLRPDKWRIIQEEQRIKFEKAYENQQVAMTSQFKCSRCKGNQCSYYVLQTRSADEGSTFFVTCLSCGHQWRMG
jgi:DNA-directed RNA polymerase subunit M/transcription elongation factor TFIIS